jgi:hypothetical protein
MRSLGIVIGLLLGCCGSVPVTAQTGPTLTVVSGQRQLVNPSGPSGTAAFLPVVVKALDAKGAPMVGLPVTFAAPAAKPMICNINPDGRSPRMTLQTGADGTAALQQMPNGSSMICRNGTGRVVITASASNDTTAATLALVGVPPYTLEVIRGNQNIACYQCGTAKCRVCRCDGVAVVAQLVDAWAGAPLQNQAVGWSLNYPAGTGSGSNPVQTGSDGTVSITLGGAVGQFSGNFSYAGPQGPVSAGFAGSCFQ